MRIGQIGSAAWVINETIQLPAGALTQSLLCEEFCEFHKGAREVDALSQTVGLIALGVFGAEVENRHDLIEKNTNALKTAIDALYGYLSKCEYAEIYLSIFPFYNDVIAYYDSLAVFVNGIRDDGGALPEEPILSERWGKSAGLLSVLQKDCEDIHLLFNKFSPVVSHIYHLDNRADYFGLAVGKGTAKQIISLNWDPALAFRLASSDISLCVLHTNWTDVAARADVRVTYYVLDTERGKSGKMAESVVSYFECDGVVGYAYLDLVRMLQLDICIKRCENCKKLFIPENKSDELYCRRPTGKSDKTCKEVGPSRTHKKTLLENPILLEKQAIYDEYYNKHIRKHKNNKDARKRQLSILRRIIGVGESIIEEIERFKLSGDTDDDDYEWELQELVDRFFEWADDARVENDLEKGGKTNGDNN